MKRPRLLLAFLLVAAIVQLVWIGSQMPDTVATHFDGAGHPNGGMTRGGMIAFQLMMLGIMAATFLGLPILLGRLSPSLINIPHRDYWLSPERREASMTGLRNWMAGMGCGVVMLLMAIAELLHHANRVSPPRLSSPALLGCLGAFLVYVVGSIVALYRRFPPPPSAQRT